MSVSLFTDFDVASVCESGVKNLDTGGKIVWLSHGSGSNKGPIVLQTAVMRTPTGIREDRFKGDDKEDTASGAPQKFAMELELTDSLELEKLKAFDERIIAMALEAKGRWLSLKNYDRGSLDNSFSNTVRVPRDKITREPSDKWPVTMKVGVPKRNGTFQCEAWDLFQQPVGIEDFMERGRNAQVTAIIRCTGVWTAAGRFGTTWKLQQLLVHSTKSVLNSFAFIGMRAPETTPQRPSALPSPEKAAPAASRAGPDDDDDEYLEDSD
jgi:hypothetical protein